jgi:pimeloyl-ACP methyl ester carboxylesterase
MERKYYQTQYGRISLLDRGTGYPVIFLHGLGGTGNTWLKSEPFLDSRLRPIFVDLLGHGHSDKPEIDYTIIQQAEAIKSIIDAMGLKNFSIVGNSYGGWIGLKFASSIAQPDMLFPVDSAGISPTPAEQGPQAVESLIDSILKARNYKNRDALRRIMNNNGKREEKITQEDLAAISCPTTIIWGTEDHVIPLSYGEALKAGIKGSELIIIDGSGHTPHIDKPEEFSEIINKKLQNKD